MTISPSAVRCEYIMDPGEVVDFIAPFARWLQDGEVLDSFTVTLATEATAVGVELGSGDYAAALANDATAVRFWLQVDAEEQNNAAFESVFHAAITVHVETTSVPARERELTCIVRIVQK